jgi:hypothetical protein
MMLPIRTSFLGLILALLIISCAPAQNIPEPALIPHAYTVSTGSILNPERGFFTPYQLPGNAGFSPVRLTGYTLVHVNIRLDSWRETDIPQKVLDGLNTNFADMRDGGVKVIVRFAYNVGPYPDSAPDASKEMILHHIQQLTPLLQSNADVIAWLEMGFIGAWGEGHTSTHGLDNITDKKDILFALLDALPKNRMVQVRYPTNIIEMFPEVLTAGQAFDGSNQSRVGHHNDCFLASSTDQGTYDQGGVNSMERDQAYLAELTRFTPMSGETCAPNPPRSECPSTLQEMALLHFSSINQSYHQEVIRDWKHGGCFEEISNRLGYRLALTNANFNEQVRPGGILDIKVALDNTGFASIINEHPLYLVLDGAKRYAVKVEQIDPRSWEGGQTSSFTVQLRVPSDAAEGEYRLALWLPDAAESLQNDPRYAIQFANENIWDEKSGFNVLGKFSIAEKAGGGSQSGSKLEVVSTSAGATTPLPKPTQIPSAVPSSAAPSVPQGELLSNPLIDNDADNLTVQFTFLGDQASYNGYQVFFDTDQNPETGYTFSVGGLGADFLFENGAFSSYAGTGADWTWTPVETELTFSTDNQTAKWILPRAALGKVSSFDVVFRLMDINWNIAFLTPKATYIIK